MLLVQRLKVKIIYISNYDNFSISHQGSGVARFFFLKFNYEGKNLKIPVCPAYRQAGDRQDLRTFAFILNF